jgi:hypothetical protein
MKRKTMRVLVAIGAPLALLAFAVLVSVITSFLNQSNAGRALMWIATIAILVGFAIMAWEWDGWEGRE